MITEFAKYNYDKIKITKERLKGLEEDMPVKWIDSLTGEERSGYFFDYGGTYYKVKVYNPDNTHTYPKPNYWNWDYVSFKNKTFQLNDLEIDAKKYNL